MLNNLVFLYLQCIDRNICVILFTPPPSLHVYWRHFSFQSSSVYTIQCIRGCFCRRWCTI